MTDSGIFFKDKRMTNKNNQKHWLRISELSKHFSVSERTVFRWIKAGCPRLKIGKSGARFNPEDVEQWLASCEAVNAR